MLTLFDRYARQVLARPRTCLFLALLLALFFAFCGRDVRLNNQFATLFSIDNDANAYRAFYRESFDADDAVLVGVLKPGATTDDFFNAVIKATAELEKNPHFVRVISPTNTSVVYSDPDSVYIDPLFGRYDDGRLTLEEKLKYLRESPATADRLVAVDVDTFAILAQMPENYDRLSRIQEPAAMFREAIESAMAGQNVTTHYAGIAFTRIGILKLMLQDLVMLVPLTGIAVAFFSMWLFRRWMIVWVTLLTTIFGLACTVGVMGLRDDDINQMTLTFPVLLMVIIVANSIHFFHRYFRELEDGRSVEDAVYITTARIGRSAFLSCFTTMIGFYALMTADMMILRSFGFYLGTGVLMSFAGMMLVIPPALLLFEPSLAESRRHHRVGIIDHTVAFCISPGGRKGITAFGVVLLIGGVMVSSQASYDYFLSDMLDNDHPQVIAGEVLDEEMAGALPLEISLLGEAGDFKRAEVLQKMQMLSDWLKQRGYGDSALSLASITGALNKAISGEDKMPETDAAVAQLLLLAEGSSDNIVQQLVNEDYSHARIKGNVPDLGADKIMQLQNAFHDYASGLMQDSGITVRMTGEIPVAYEGMNKLTEELIKSVLTAMVFVVLTIFAVFRDLRLAIGSIFPNLLPIIVGLGIYSLSGQALNPLPGIAFCIAIGIAVDDTVHLFARFNEEMAKGLTRIDAIKNAVFEVKGALVSSSVMLTAGFAVFLLSAFTWNRELGMLGMVLIVTALLADLIFTPAILSFGHRDDKPGITDKSGNNV